MFEHCSLKVFSMQKWRANLKGRLSMVLVDDAEVADGGSNAPNPGGDFHQGFILFHNTMVSALEAQQIQTGHCNKTVFLFSLPEINLFAVKEAISTKGGKWTGN